MRVKLSTAHPAWPYLRQTPGGAGRWGDTTFLLEDDGLPFDWWVVAEGVRQRETVRVPAGRKVLLTWEPPCRLTPYSQDFLDQFDVVITSHAQLSHPRVVLEQQGLPWFVERSYDQLVNETNRRKERLLSIVSSAKVAVPGHRTRLRLAHALAEHFGDRADLYGRGIRDFDHKWDVLAPYRYTVAVENDLSPFYVSEKLTDCFLTGTFPFYGGAPNVSSWFPEGSYIPIDPADIAGTIDVIEGVLADPDHFARSQSALAAAKAAYLDHHQLFPMLHRVLPGLAPSGRTPDVEVQQVRPEFAPPSTVRRLARRVKRTLRR